MDFREEYKNSAEIMGPSEEAMTRMKNNIMEQLEKASAKKPFPFRTAAAVCGGLAACAAVVLVCVNVIPRLNAHTDLTAGSSAAAVMDDRANENAAQAENAQTPADDAAVGAKDMGVGSDDTAAVATTTAVANGIADSSANIPFDILADDAVSADDCDYTEAADDAVAEDYNTNMDSTDDTPAATIDSVIQDSGAVFGEEDEILFKLSEDMSELFIGDRIYVLTDDGLAPPSAELVCENHFAPDGTEYRFDRYGDNYIVLSRDNGSGSFEIVGGYKIAE